MYVLTNKQMREADEYTINESEIPSLTLMERAGRALADEAEKLAPKGRILCVCGSGNNGGDGFVCARVLRERGREVAVVFCAESMSDDCRVNFGMWLDMGGDVLPEVPTGNGYAVFVDCLFGTGFHGAVHGADERAVKRMNGSRAEGVKILAADVPSGVNGENGRVEGVAVKADVTLCIGEVKTGVLLGDGIDHAGVIKRADIGIELPHGDRYATWTDKKTAQDLLPQRRRNSHKGSYGSAAIVAGSEEYTGAAYLATAACLRAGAGYTTLFTPTELLPYYILKAPEALLKPMNEGGRVAFTEENFKKLLSYDSIAYGMGAGVSEDVAKGAMYLLDNFEGRLILDADALNSLSEYEKENLSTIFAKKKCDVLLTPHVKEFSRLSGKTLAEILDGGLAPVEEFAEKYNVNVLLKNAVSIVTDGKRTALNTAGTSGQAKGGSGDVLSGVIAGLCACGLTTFDGACLGSYVVGTAAEMSVKKTGEYSLLASHVISYLGASFLSLQT